MAKLPDQDNIALEMYEAAARSRDKARTYLGMSQIGNACERALWYQFRGYNAKPLDGRILMLFRFGDRIEEEIIYWLNKAGYKVEGQQEGFSDFNGSFRGHSDGTVHGITSQPHILECKSCNTKKFKAFKTNGIRRTSETYYAQSQCYMGYSGLERCLFVVQCKDTSELYTERVYFDLDEFRSLKEKAHQIISANDAPPITLRETSFDCKWCDYAGHCRNPDETPLTNQTCGNCRHVYFDDIQPWCKVHQGKLNHWGKKCGDWDL